MDKSKFLFTESSHLPFDNENTLSMAYINKTCLEVETCTHPTFRYVLQHLANCKTEKNVSGVQCAPNSYDDIVQKMKAVNLKEHEYFRDVIQNSLQTFAVQINMRLKPGQISKFPEKYFFRKQTSTGRTNKVERGDFSEYSLKGSVINLMNKRETGKSVGSNAKADIYIGDRDENHSLDIVSKFATEKDPFDYIRVNITGRIEDATKTEGEKYAVPLEIDLPNLPKVKMNVLVQPSYSTFTELDYAQ